MFRLGLRRSLVIAIGALILVSCSEGGISAPTAPSAVASKASPANLQLDKHSLTGPVTDAFQLDLKAVWWKKPYKNVISVSKTIDQSGGTISIPETGLTVSFPAGAVTGPIAITITSDQKYVAYKMEPTGTRFLKDVTVTQLLNTTSIFGEPLRNQLYAVYIADDNVKLSGKVPALEIEPSTTIFSGLLPQAHVWIIRHFSHYMLASG
jgi:hypothetical protein